MKKLVIMITILLSGLASSAFAADRSLPGITIITRAQRWANENIRFSNTPYAIRKANQKAKSEAELQELAESNYDQYLTKSQEANIANMRNDYLYSNYADEQSVDTTSFLYGMDYLSWPQSYHFNKNKIIIHHTAWDTSAFTGIESAKAYMREIYAYHTSKWWDIGYNFVVDPYGNIYEGRAGGDWVIWAHDAWNNTPSVWISLMGNFEIQKPTNAQIKSLIALVTALARKYHIDPLAKTEYHIVTNTPPYMKSVTNYALAGHRDAGITSCPGKYLYAQLPDIRKAVRSNLQNGILVNSVSVAPNTTSWTTTPTKTYSRTTNPNILKSRTNDLESTLSGIKQSYMSANKIVASTGKTTKVTSQISLATAKKLMAWDIKVLLYDLSTNYKKRTVTCDNTCLFTVGKKNFSATTWIIESQNNQYTLSISGSKVSLDKVIVKDTSGGLVTIANYTRVSYAKIPWNTFHGTLAFARESVKNLNSGKFAKQTAIVNTLPFTDYLRDIAETNDTEYPEKIRVMQLISKWYALFYMTGKNKHPAIPVGATYNAIDDPNSFQKYVWAGLEKTLTKVYTQLETTKNKLVTYKGNLPILPYFSCSAGFTRSGKEKRWWKDTPYIVSRIDPVSCDTFSGHGVWLSWKWAQYLAMQWRSAEDILKYYYPGITISSR